MPHGNSTPDNLGHVLQMQSSEAVDVANINVPKKLILREAEVVALTGLSASSIRNRCNPESPWYDPEFPLPVSLSNGKRRSAIGWRTAEVVHWISTRRRAFNFHQVDARPKRIKRPRTPASADVSWRL